MLEVTSHPATYTPSNQTLNRSTERRTQDYIMSNNEVIKLYNTQQAGQFLQVGADHIRVIVKQGKLSARKLAGGRRYYFTADDLNAYLEGKR